MLFESIWTWLGLSTALYLGLRFWERRFQWLKDANKCIEAGDSEQGLFLAEKALAQNPRDWRALYIAGICLQESHDPVRALEMLEKARAGKPDKQSATTILACRAYCKALLRDFEQSINDATHALEEQRHIAGASLPPGANAQLQLIYQLLVLRATIYILSYRFEQALAELNEAVALAPNMHQAYLWRSSAYVEMNNREAAASDLEKATTLLAKTTSVETADFLIVQANFSSRKGDFEGAIEDASKAIEVDGKNPNAYLNRANCLASLKQFDKAVADLNTADKLAHYPLVRSYILSQRARIALVQNDPAGGLSLAEQSLSQCATPATLCTRAAALLKNGDLERAEQDLQRAEEMHQNYAEIWWLKGKLLEKRGAPEEAEGFKEKARQLGYVRSALDEDTAQTLQTG